MVAVDLQLPQLQVMLGPRGGWRVDESSPMGKEEPVCREKGPQAERTRRLGTGADQGPGDWARGEIPLWAWAAEVGEPPPVQAPEPAAVP